MRTLQKVSAVTLGHSKVDLGSMVIFEHSGGESGLDEILGPVPDRSQIFHLEFWFIEALHRFRIDSELFRIDYKLKRQRFVVI